MKKLVLITFISMSLLLASVNHAHETKNKKVEFYSSEIISKLNLPFSEAVRVENILFLSGQIGIDSQTGKLVEGGIKTEARQAMNNIQNTLKSLGYTMKNIVKCTVMLADIAEWQAFNEVYVTYFSKPFPARSAFGASGLGFNSRVEIECIAAVGQ